VKIENEACQLNLRDGIDNFVQQKVRGEHL